MIGKGVAVAVRLPQVPAMLTKPAVVALAALLSLCGPHVAVRSANKTAIPSVIIEAKTDRRWSVTYALSAPTRALVFDRSPDSSRTKSWTVPAPFELVTRDQRELVRRRDGEPFTEVTADVPAAYQVLPKDYAPFSPFADGGMLVHSGRFFACPENCPEKSKWRFSLRAPAGRHIIVDGRRHAGTVSWLDREDGRNVYVGAAKPLDTRDVVAIVDSSLPADIRERLGTELPRFMRFFARRLGPLPSRPMLFASYDAAYRQGWGRQGGTLPGQVFTHFYGSGWSAEMAKPGFDFDLAWFFAHEAGHLYQRQVTASEKGAAWVHEGAAEAFAAIALRQLNPAFGSRIEARAEEARTSCASATRQRPLTAVVEGGDFAAAYSCGLLINLAIHDAALAARPKSEGLFTVWRGFAELERRGRPPMLSDFIRAVSKVTGTCAAEKVVEAVSTTQASAIAVSVRSCRDKAGPSTGS